MITAFPVEKLEVCIRPVQIADDDGKKPTVLPSFDAAKTIWGKCCVDLSVKAAKKVSKTAYKTLDRGKTHGKATAEEASLITLRVEPAIVCRYSWRRHFNRVAGPARIYAGGGATFGTPGCGRCRSRSRGRGSHYRCPRAWARHGLPTHKPADTVMAVIASKHDQRESDKVATVICDKVRTFTTAKSSGKKTATRTQELRIQASQVWVLLPRPSSLDCTDAGGRATHGAIAEYSEGLIE